MTESWADGAGIALDHEGDVPLGTQLDWAFRAAVTAGRLQAGERLPGLREVAEQLGVNHNTVRAAVAKLEADGVLVTRHGAGTFVAAHAGAHDAHASLIDETARRARDAGLAPRDLAAALYVTDTTSGRPQDAAGGDDAAAERRAVREELAVLDRVMVALEARLAEPLPRETPPSRGPRLLSIDELRAQRDAIVRRIAAVQRALDSADDEDPDGGPVPDGAPARRGSSRAAAPRPGIAPA
jgi:DNA-binding transcriptional regulator YhcF (GntR family)